MRPPYEFIWCHRVQASINPSIHQSATINHISDYVVVAHFCGQKCQHESLKQKHRSRCLPRLPKKAGRFTWWFETPRSKDDIRALWDKLDSQICFFFFPSLGGVKSDRDHEITPFFSWGEAKNANGWWIFKRNFMEFLWISPKIRAILWVGTHERKMPKMPESDKQLVCFLSPGLQDPSSTGEITAKGMMLGLCPWPSVNLSNEQKPWLFAVGGFYYPANIGIVRS